MRVRISKCLAMFLVYTGSVTLGGCRMDGLPETNATPVPDPAASGSNRPPSISGNPPGAVKINENYSFTPTATDPDGDPLTFSAQNLPLWALFDKTIGKISGIPNPGDEATYDNIVISVNDGQDSSSLNAFSITVTQVSPGSASLSWTAPTQNTDGSPLTDLAGYKIYYGTETGNYQSSVQIDNPGITTFVVENLTATTYYFASTAFNTSGVESPFSNEAVKVIN